MRSTILKFLVWLKLLKRIEPGVQPELVLPDPAMNHPDPFAVRQVTLGVIVGHTKADKGADFFGGGNEYDYNSGIAKLIEKCAAGSRVKVEIIYRDGIGIDGAYSKAYSLGCDCVIELHCNAFNGVANGTLTYTSPAAEDVSFAHAVHKAMLSVFGTEGRDDRGVVCLSRNDRGGKNVYSFNGMPNCLVEPFFCDHPSDVALGRQHAEKYAQALVSAVILWAKKLDLIS